MGINYRNKVNTCRQIGLYRYTAFIRIVFFKQPSPLKVVNHHLSVKRSEDELLAIVTIAGVLLQIGSVLGRDVRYVCTFTAVSVSGLCLMMQQ